ncbi:MAG: tryptophan--tRNA ligase [Actinomycetota bacterium]|jgi:tryptophanyl-tRNA synthetase|nr:tryptophan--tRNA ligase [Actinomycetota bacterium]MDA8294381.1 tryptophan--tRNA ligase [Actinomycetota bacterium]
MPRVFSGIQPSGELHLGNYLGAIRSWVRSQHEADAFYCIVDLHALTVETDPAELRARTRQTALELVAAGLDPDACTLFVQSHVPEHPRLTWLLECTASMGELRRMTQFKDKSAGAESVRVGLFTYPVLMAADILLYDTDRVPVGDDQRQHLELARELASRFNARYGTTFVVPEAAVPPVGARVMDLQHPERKMSKSVSSPLGTVLLFDEPADIERKVKKAVTDTDGEVRYDPEAKPGLANLLELLAVATDRAPAAVAAEYHRYGDLKRDVATALCDLLAPARARRNELAGDPGAIDAVLADGAAKAQAIAADVYHRAASAIGLLAPA